MFDSQLVWDRFAAYVAYVDEAPVSTAAIVIGGGAIGVYNVATMPDRQRRGYGEAVMRYALAEAQREHGIERSTLQSTPAGLRLYQRMGYRTITRVLGLRELTGMPDFFRFLPLQNPLGFGAGDYLELLIATMLLAALVWWKRVEPHASRLAQRTVWSMALLALLPVVLRLALLPHHPVPTPDVYDEFSHLLVADTLRHLRLANPPHSMHAFFETFFVLQQPTYSSIYPLGQGLLLAIGWTFLGTPWAGVVLATAVFCALCYWMLRGWTTPGWALAGGLLAAIEFGPLSQWMNSYWGGSLAAVAGCLVFGALPRLQADGRRRDALLLGLGLAIT
ncbi:MAG: GNAT family N-acetyltransferase [Ignavibacteriota bacterium]